MTTTTQASWRQPEELSGGLLVLRPLRVEDAGDYLAAAQEAEPSEVFAHLTIAAPVDLDAARQVIRQAVTDPDRWAFAQRLAATGEFVGTTSFYEISPALRALAIGHTWVARRHWRSAVNTTSKLVLMTHAFETLGAERLVWHTDILNLRSQAAIERLGAQREGVLRHHRIRRDGSWRDTVQFSLLAQEWPRARDRLQARLKAHEHPDETRS